MAGNQIVACDVESVTPRAPAVWRDLLGESGCDLAESIARERSEMFDITACRLWTIRECLKKAGAPVEAPLVQEAAAEDGWLVLRSGDLAIASYLIAVHGIKEPMAVAFAVGRGQPMRPAAA